MKIKILCAFVFFIFCATALSCAQVAATAFGFQCNVGASNGNCPNNGSSQPTWPSATYVPHLLRLWDAQVQWGAVMTGYSGGVGSYTWTQLDGWLDTIAANNPTAVMYTIGRTPCPWDMPSGGTCQTTGTVGSPNPPVDLPTYPGCGTLGSSACGSPSFDQFITDLTNHCNSHGKCVATYIKYFELWNEASNTASWTGTQSQLYQLLAPAVAIIRANVSGVKIVDSPEGSATGHQAWMNTWLATEVTNGVLSDIFAFHVYLADATPENKITYMNSAVCPNNGLNGACGQVAGWTALPWWMTEGTLSEASNNFNCNLSIYSAADCTGQIVRWQLLILSNGGSGLDWYDWNQVLGSVNQYDTAYGYMMQYLTGGTFGSACSNVSGTIWTCAFTESNSTVAEWVWTTSETAGQTFTVPSGYTRFRDLAGGTTGVVAGNSMPISVQPVMLESIAPTAWQGPAAWID